MATLLHPDRAVPPAALPVAVPAAARWRAFWTPRRVRLYGGAAIAAAWLPAVGVAFRGWLDFSAFYTAASFAFTPDVARLEPIVRAQAEQGLPLAPFLYPPGFVLPYTALSWLPYPIAGAIHAVVMLGLLLLAARLAAGLFGLPRRLAMLGAMAWGPAAASVLGGQNATLALLLVVLTALALVHASRPSAGLAVAALGFKPTFTPPLLGLLLLRGRWSAFVVAIAVGVIGHYLLGVLATGGHWGWPSDWMATLAAYSDADVAANGWQAVSLPALLARFEAPAWLGWQGVAGLQGLSPVGYASGGLIVLACLPALRHQAAPRAVALAAAAGVVVMPHAWIHNATLLLPGLAVLAADAGARGWPARDRWMMAALFGAGLTWGLGGIVGITLLPVVAVVLPLLLLAGGRRASRDTG